MKAKVRVLKTHDRNSVYSHLYFEFLMPRWVGSKDLTPAFSISWQTDTESDKWYAMSFEVSTDNPLFLAYATKVARYLDKTLGWDEKNPDGVRKRMAMELHTYKEGQFLPCRMSGCNEYRVYRNAQHYTTIFAFSEDEANEALQEISGDPTFTFKLWAENIDLMPVSWYLSKKTEYTAI